MARPGRTRGKVIRHYKGGDNVADAYGSGCESVGGRHDGKGGRYQSRAGRGCRQFMGDAKGGGYFTDAGGRCGEMGTGPYDR